MKKLDEGIIFNLAKQLEKYLVENPVKIGSLPEEELLKIVHQWALVENLLDYILDRK